jgi:hypothetical protein
MARQLSISLRLAAAGPEMVGGSEFSEGVACWSLVSFAFLSADSEVSEASLRTVFSSTPSTFAIRTFDASPAVTLQQHFIRFLPSELAHWLRLQQINNVEQLFRTTRRATRLHQRRKVRTMQSSAAKEEPDSTRPRNWRHRKQENARRRQEKLCRQQFVDGCVQALGGRVTALQMVEIERAASLTLFGARQARQGVARRGDRYRRYGPPRGRAFPRSPVALAGAGRSRRFIAEFNRGSHRVSKLRRPANIIDAVTLPDWWGPWFPKPESWAAWRTFWKATFALPMDAEDLYIFRQCTARTNPPTELPKEIAEVIGRRGGKSRAAATTAAWLAVFVDWRPHLGPGEKAVVMLLAADRRQSRVALRYIRSLILDHPELKKLVATVRGYSVAALIADEIAFWFDGENSANPAEEVLAAARPAMATMGPNALLLLMSSPHARRGPLWQAHRRHYGHEDAPILVWQAPTKVMNPTVPQSVIDAAYEDDAARAGAEFGAEFRTDVESYISREAVEACVVSDRFELPPMTSVTYSAFVDPSGGSSDSMTLAIAFREGERAILAAIREVKPPFSPESVVADFCTLLKTYRIHTVIGDRYAGLWPRERFQAHGISYDAAAKPKSDLYRDFLPAVNGRRVELLDHPKMVAQLCSLERRTWRGGRDSIDHPPGGAHDDVINAVAGALTNLIVVEAPTAVFGFYGSGGYGFNGAYTTHDPNAGAGAVFASMPPEYWAARGIFHPSDRQRYIDAGIYKPPEGAKS